MANESGEWFWPVVMLGAAVWFWKPSADELSGRITAYRIVCKGDAHDPTNPICSAGWDANAALAFSVDSAQQLVVQMEGDKDPERLEHCTVADRENWVCDSSFLGRIRMHDGRADYEPSDWSVKFVPQWRWYMFKYFGS